MNSGQRIRRVHFDAPTPYGLEVMTLARLREMAPPGYLRTPQRPTFHLLIMGTSGTTNHTVDFRDYPISSKRVVWVRPGQVQRFSEQDAAQGDLILFEADFLLPGTRAAALAADRFGAVTFEPTAATRDLIEASRRDLRNEYARAITHTQCPDAAQLDVFRHLLSVLVLRVSTCGCADPPDKRDSHTLFERFRELLELDFAIAHDVDHYARALGYSTRTLARATSAAAGQSPKQMIQERVALEAGRLLAHSNLAIAAIAVHLHFRDPANFSTFVTRHLGASPTKFRAEHRPTQAVAVRDV